MSLSQARRRSSELRRYKYSSSNGGFTPSNGRLRTACEVLLLVLCNALLCFLMWSQIYRGDLLGGLLGFKSYHRTNAIVSASNLSHVYGAIRDKGLHRSFPTSVIQENITNISATPSVDEISPRVRTESSPITETSSFNDPIELEESSPTQGIDPTSDLELISLNATVIASVRGNLAPPSVLVDPSVEDWIADRWQAARNMRGRPIPGPHWIVLTLKEPANDISIAVLDFENAFSNTYELASYCERSNSWRTFYKSTHQNNGNKVKVERSYRHIIHRIDVDDVHGGKVDRQCPISKVRLHIKRPATLWGVSLWQIQLWGHSMSSLAALDESV
mmetsp:Transcript_6238/g.9405  ORF Transcript_6238/g.9405 Transcript_6238/m.9405 type:complete len:332 (-) Transcript_6238:154-1149(-)|eukprot:CAMPEP_0185027840 /NCGR_PEP_ID=MMETSP1103-20130426/13101_1 /TAXON_ID=36769 /ORGANISM="Paraphysomonas bandaiensis, Strain Caron Lab Isolate" /LENGTH=331 /DNA_ID=CAMNT_0027561989 /DNA_START=40 /DNA_END=1038 /DNA_ORIENTATION=-